MTSLNAQSTAFGRQLKRWRDKRGMSQLKLASLAETTPRHISFIETGRSRPGRDVVLRIARSLELRPRDCNALLASAGLAHAYAEHTLDERELQPVLTGLHTMLEAHNPFPAAVIDEPGQVHICNRAYETLLPDACQLTPEQSIDRFYGSEGQAAIENWAEVAWSTAERRRRRAERSDDPRLTSLADRAFGYLADVPRPPVASDSSPVLTLRLQIGDLIIPTYTAVVRFETAHEVMLSELRVELIYPVDESGAEFFRSLG